MESLMKAACPADVPVNLIDAENSEFRLTREKSSQELMRSVARYGVCEPLVLLAQEKGFVIVFGHHRCGAALAADLSSVPALVWERFDAEDYLRCCISLLYQKRLSHCARIRAAEILAARGASPACIRQCEQAFGMRERSRLAAFLERLEAGGFSALLGYCEQRDLSFKYLLALAAMPDDVLGLLNEMLEQVDIRINIFRQILEMVDDIVQKQGVLPVHLPELFAADASPREKEAVLLSLFQELRYPDYTAYMSRMNALRRELEKGGLTVELPEHLEGDRITLRLEIPKNEDPSRALKDMQGIRIDVLTELLEKL